MMKKRKTGIIVARFQTSHLHEGHLKTIRYVKERNERVIVFLGVKETKLTINNPLNFEARQKMVLEIFPDAEVYPIADCKTDSAWSNQLDKLVEEKCGDDDIVLYGSRGSFLSNYHGKYRTEFAGVVIDNISATQIRESHHGYVDNSRDWRKGVIWASAHKYPASYQAIDVAIIDFAKQEILLGRKKHEERFRFIGGFVDVADTSLEHACKREVSEECGSNLETDGYRYIGSFRVDDWRYRNEADKILTAFFCCHVVFGGALAKPADDITELKWFGLDALWENDIEAEHAELLQSLKKFLKNNKG